MFHSAIRWVAVKKKDTGRTNLLSHEFWGSQYCDPSSGPLQIRPHIRIEHSIPLSLVLFESMIIFWSLSEPGFPRLVGFLLGLHFRQLRRLQKFRPKRR
jgi:hypothetical protein